MQGRLQTGGGGAPTISFERDLEHGPGRVWRALTEPAELARWLPTTITGERRAGARLLFEFPQGQAPPFEGEMLIFEAPIVMELRWGTDALRFELQPRGPGTSLTLRATLDELGKAARDAAGWHACLDALTDSLDGTPGPPISH